MDPIESAARMAALVEKGPLALFGAVFCLAFFWLLFRVHLREVKAHAATIAKIHESGREESVAMRLALTKFLLHIEREQMKASRRQRRAPDAAEPKEE